MASTTTNNIPTTMMAMEVAMNSMEGILVAMEVKEGPREEGEEGEEAVRKQLVCGLIIHCSLSTSAGYSRYGPVKSYSQHGGASYHPYSR